MWPASEHQRLAYIRWLTANTVAFIAYIREHRGGVNVPDQKKPRNLLRLAGVINAANAEADNEAGELIARIRTNQARALGLIAKGHQNEALREQMLAEAEKEQQLADLEAAVGDNGGPLLEEEPDDANEKLRETLRAAKSQDGSKDSQEGQGEAIKPGAPTEPPPFTDAPQAAPSPPAVGQQPNFHE